MASLAAFAGTAFAYMRIRGDEIQNSHQAAILQSVNAQTTDKQYPMASPVPVTVPPPLLLGGAPVISSLPVADNTTSTPSAALSATASTPLVAGSTVLLPAVSPQIAGHDTGASAAITAVQAAASSTPIAVTSTVVAPAAVMTTNIPSFSTGDDMTPFIIMPDKNCVR